jgi:hypothetical protein
MKHRSYSGDARHVCLLSNIGFNPTCTRGEGHATELRRARGITNTVSNNVDSLLELSYIAGGGRGVEQPKGIQAAIETREIHQFNGCVKIHLPVDRIWYRFNGGGKGGTIRRQGKTGQTE